MAHKCVHGFINYYEVVDQQSLKLQCRLIGATQTPRSSNPKHVSRKEKMRSTQKVRGHPKNFLVFYLSATGKNPKSHCVKNKEFQIYLESP